MSKKQVVLMSLLVALPALALVIVLVMQGLANSAQFSGIMWVFVVIAGALGLVVAASPAILGALYPAEGFAGMAPPPTEAPAGTPPATNPDADEFEETDDDGGFDDDEEFADAGDGEELFDDGFEDEAYDDDDLGDFEDDEEEWV